jgi:putative membrane protein
MWGIYDGWLGWGAGHMLARLAFWMLFIAAAVFVVRHLSGQALGASETALDVLKKRYARGEIEADEFARKKRELSD